MRGEDGAQPPVDVPDLDVVDDAEQEVDVVDDPLRRNLQGGGGGAVPVVDRAVGVHGPLAERDDVAVGGGVGNRAGVDLRAESGDVEFGVRRVDEIDLNLAADGRVDRRAVRPEGGG